MVCFLYRGAAGDWKGRVVVTDGGNALVEEIVGSAHAADGVVNLWRTIERDDDVVEESGDFFCAFVQQETCGEERKVNLPVTKEVAEGGQVIVEQRLST